MEFDESKSTASEADDAKLSKKDEWGEDPDKEKNHFGLVTEYTCYYGGLKCLLARHLHIELPYMLLY